MKTIHRHRVQGVVMVARK